MKKLIILTILFTGTGLLAAAEEHGLFSLEEDFFILKTGIPETPEVRVEYLIPVKNGVPVPSANNVVFCAPFLGDKKPLNAYQRRYVASRLGFTVYSLRIKDDIKNVGIRNKYYVFPESGWHEPVFAAKQAIVKRFNFENRNLLIIAASAGGSMAQQLACSHPGEIDAVVFAGGRFFDPVPLRKNIAWLALNTWGDHTAEANKRLCQNAERRGIQILTGQTPPCWIGKTVGRTHHTPSARAWDLMRSFLKDVVKLRENNGGVMPPPPFWPIARKAAGKTLFFPSKTFLMKWSSLPHNITSKIDDPLRDKDKPVIMHPEVKPEKVVLLVDDFRFQKPSVRMDDIYYISSNKAVAYSVETSEDFDESSRRIKLALQDILSREEWLLLPVYVIGWGQGGQLSTIEALLNDDCRITKITTLNSQFSSAIKKYSISSYCNAEDQRLTMLFDNEAAIPKLENKDIKIIYSNNSKKRLLYNMWFRFLDAAADIDSKKARGNGIHL